MADRKEERKLTYYICGWCRDEIHHQVGTEPPIPCPNCGWMHLTRRYDDVPSEVKIDIS